MEDRRLDGQTLVQALEAAGRRLNEAGPTINRLNVFPVPDADTGTNLSLTFDAGLRALAEHPASGAAEVLSRFAKGLIFGARGNSGVILSQFFLGLAGSLRGEVELSLLKWSEAWNHGAEAAYRAVQKPVEGTMLSIARDTARAWIDGSSEGWEAAARAAVAAAESVLEGGAPDPSGRRQPGVVDSGALGFAVILDAFVETLAGVSLPWEADIAVVAKGRREDRMAVSSASMDEALSIECRRDESGAGYGYCTECLIQVAGRGESMTARLEQSLSGLGDSLLVVQVDEWIKVHIHSFHPGTVLERCLSFGPLDRIKIDNMQMQVNQEPKSSEVAPASPQPRSAVPRRSLVAAVDDEGAARLFEGAGVPAVVLSEVGGKSGAVSVLSRVVQETGSAETAVLVCQSRSEADVKRALRTLGTGVLRVIRAGSVPEGLAAACVFEPTRPLDENERRMKEAMARVRSGFIRKVSHSGPLRPGARSGLYEGMVDGQVVAVGETISPVLLGLIERLGVEEAELVTVIWGKRVSAQEERAVREQVSVKFPGLSFEWLRGDETTYDAVVGVE
ncbi:MAG: DAK2 domain-containing protein [Kyrpidia tusciae]|nr:DAK2 domain-containing protein [Kyrpidia tusciae]MBE3552972.1 DAK2 domain-containing protein [Kyrpidia tusciae]